MWCMGGSQEVLRLHPDSFTHTFSHTNIICHNYTKRKSALLRFTIFDSSIM